MKFLILFSFIFQTCYSIDVHFNQFYFKGIKSIEIPSCESEPCVLRIGQQLPVKITFEAEFLTPNATYYGEVTDANVRFYVNYYRDRYQYNLAYFRSLCKSQLIECPIVEKNYYTISTYLFISKTDPIGETHSFPDTGLKSVYFDIGLDSTKGGDLIGSAIVKIDFQY